MMDEPLTITVASLLAEFAYAKNTFSLEDIIEFDGPAVGDCFGQRYTTLTQYGAKAEGELAVPAGFEPHWVRDQAIFHFKRMLWEWLKSNAVDAKQLAWRARPRVSQSEVDGSFIVRCRLAVH